MWSKLLTRFKKRQAKPSYENVVCANCKTQFSGKFCPNCGQAVTDYDKPFSFVFYNFMGEFFAFDTRFFRTFIALLFKPGILTKEYMEGRRVRYAPPFRIFVFVSFILFLLLQNYTNRGLTSVLDADLKDAKIGLDSTYQAVDSLVNIARMEMDSSEALVVDSILSQNGIMSDSKVDSTLHFNGNLASFRNTRNLRKALTKFAVGLEEKLEKEENPKERARIREHIRLCRSPEQGMAKILQYISWAFFLLLPILALLLKLVYARRKQNYIRHLVFSIHIHAFIYVVMIVLVGLYRITNANLEPLTVFMALAVPVYLIMAMKKFYEQGIRKTIAKFLFVTFIYNIIFLALVIGASLNALSII